MNARPINGEFVRKESKLSHISGPKKIFPFAQTMLAPLYPPIVSSIRLIPNSRKEISCILMNTFDCTLHRRRRLIFSFYFAISVFSRKFADFANDSKLEPSPFAGDGALQHDNQQNQKVLQVAPGTKLE